MSYRSVIISDTAQLSYKQNNIVIRKDGEEYKVPLEDVSTILLDTNHSTITTSLLSKANQHGIVVITTDDKHLPSGILLPINQYYSSRDRITEQIEQTQPFKKQLWQKIVQEKILNQSRCLKYSGRVEESEYLDKLSNRVKSGDSTRLEGIAAKYYFRKLFGNEFSRREESELNKALNYGYSILRSAIARELVAFGFVTSLGIHHHNQFNSFNLADDFIEPFRPLVDLWAHGQMPFDVVFSKDDKYKLVELLHNEIYIDNYTTSANNAIRETIKSYANCITTENTSKIKLPVLIGLNKHNYE